MTIRLASEMRDQLDRLAEATQRSKSFLAVEAIREYIETNKWQIQEIRAAVAEADAGNFATETEVKALTEKWNGRAGKMAENSPQKSRRRTHLHRR
jgi:RHH-type transcriptional regulator, rel operon repressor / antitoxin RelB